MIQLSLSIWRAFVDRKADVLSNSAGNIDEHSDDVKNALFWGISDNQPHVEEVSQDPIDCKTMEANRWTEGIEAFIVMDVVTKGNLLLPWLG